jgi:cellulose synthase/poly-beta-1,6-N-acetylglucosamine synthase-like glycosyltransferase
MIPALNEQNVIKNTLRRMSEIDYPHNCVEILLINDGSDDLTEDYFHEFLKELEDKPIHKPRFRFMILNVPRNIARRGKGEALNRGYKHLLQCSDFVHKDSKDNWDWIIGIVDADGWIDPHLLNLVNRKFGMPQVGAVNSSIRIRNRDAFITRLQDIEFYVVARFLNYLRGAFLSNAFMGGNGQFMRAKVLDELEDKNKYVWYRESLVEDLDIGLRIWRNGWHTKQIFTGFVHQQGVKDFGLLMRQRGRWAWGNVQVFFKFVITGKLCCNVSQDFLSRFDCFMILSNWLYSFFLFPIVIVMTILYLADLIKPVFSLTEEVLWINGAIWLLFPFAGMWASHDYSPIKIHNDSPWMMFFPRLLICIRDVIGYAFYVMVLFPLNYQAVWRVITCQKPRWAKTTREIEDGMMDAPEIVHVGDESRWDYQMVGHSVVVAQVDDHMVVDIVSVDGESLDADAPRLTKSNRINIDVDTGRSKHGEENESNLGSVDVELDSNLELESIKSNEEHKYDNKHGESMV